jgi:hypothetical protein
MDIQEVIVVKDIILESEILVQKLGMEQAIGIINQLQLKTLTLVKQVTLDY